MPKISVIRCKAIKSPDLVTKRRAVLRTGRKKYPKFCPHDTRWLSRKFRHLRDQLRPKIAASKVSNGHFWWSMTKQVKIKFWNLCLSRSTVLQRLNKNPSSNLTIKKMTSSVSQLSLYYWETMTKFLTAFQIRDHPMCACKTTKTRRTYRANGRKRPGWTTCQLSIKIPQMIMWINFRRKKMQGVCCTMALLICVKMIQSSIVRWWSASKMSRTAG